MTSPLISRPFRTVFRWQAVATLAIAAVAFAWSGWAGAWSAALGGAVSLAAGIAFAGVLGASLGDGRPAGIGRPLAAMMKAEAAKVATIVGGLAVVLTTCDGLVHGAFFAAFAVAVIVFGMALFVPDGAPRNLGNG